uniref:Uncharacterized protein n=1 Tax=Anser brachyrhynchus TaxID=132585 RepID=A0A8B9CMG9_9AVES
MCICTCTYIQICLCIYMHTYRYVYKTDGLHNDQLDNSPLKGAEGGRESSSFLLRLASCVLHSQLMHLFKATHLCQMHRVKSLINIIIFSKQNHPLFLILTQVLSLAARLS